MTRVIWVCGIGYGLGAITVGCLRAVDLWNAVGIATLLHTAGLEAVLWPISVVKWIS